MTDQMPDPGPDPHLKAVLEPPFKRAQVCVALGVPVQPGDVMVILSVLGSMSREVADYMLKVSAAVGLPSSTHPRDVIARIVELRAAAEQRKPG